MKIDEFLYKLDHFINDIAINIYSTDLIKNSLIYYKFVEERLDFLRLSTFLTRLNSEPNITEIDVVVNKSMEHLRNYVEHSNQMVIHTYNDIPDMLCLVYDGGVYPFILRKVI